MLNKEADFNHIISDIPTDCDRKQMSGSDGVTSTGDETFAI